MNTFMVTERVDVDGLSPEEIFDILKNRSGWFSGDYDGEVQICFSRPETAAEQSAREALEEAQRERARAQAREEARKKAKKEQVMAQFRKWRKTHSMYPAYIETCKRMSYGPLMWEDLQTYEAVRETLYSDRARENFLKFMGMYD